MKLVMFLVAILVASNASGSDHTFYYSNGQEADTFKEPNEHIFYREDNSDEYRYERPELNDSEEEALTFLHSGAFTPSGHDCAFGMLLGHPTVGDKSDLSKLTVSTVQTHAMWVQNGRRCECIGTRAHAAIDELPREYQTVHNIKTFLYNTMAHMALKQHRYYPWGGNVEGFDELTQRYHVEVIANYCEIPVDGLPITTF